MFICSPWWANMNCTLPAITVPLTLLSKTSTCPTGLNAPSTTGSGCVVIVTTGDSAGGGWKPQHSSCLIGYNVKILVTSEECLYVCVMTLFTFRQKIVNTQKHSYYLQFWSYRFIEWSSVKSYVFFICWYFVAHLVHAWY